MASFLAATRRALPAHFAVASSCLRRGVQPPWLRFIKQWQQSGLGGLLRRGGFPWFTGNPNSSHLFFVWSLWPGRQFMRLSKRGRASLSASSSRMPFPKAEARRKMQCSLVAKADNVSLRNTKPTRRSSGLWARRVRSTAPKNYMRNSFHMLQDCTSRVYGSRLGRVRVVIGLRQWGEGNLENGQFPCG